MKKYIAGLALFTLVWSLYSHVFVFAAGPAVRVTDSVAGEPLVLETLPMQAGKDIVFTITKPNELVTTVRAKADSDGIARAYVDADQTKRAGLYSVVASTAGGVKGKEAKIEVMAGPISPERSLLTASKTSVRADGTDTATLMLTLKDAYGNTVPDTVATLVAVRNDVITQRVSNVTDVRGEATFKVKSTTFGTVSYGVVNEDNELLVEDTIRLSYYNEGQSLSAVGGNNLLAQADSNSLINTLGSSSSSDSMSADTSTSASNENLYPAFEASGQYTIVVSIPPTAATNEAMDVTVEVLDKSGEPALDYRGTVIFESNDSNATLPLADEGYTFTAENLGTQTFFKALSFRSSGEKVVRVSDVDNPDLFGEETIVITGADGGNNPSVGGEIQVTYPSNGLRVGENTMTVIAQGPSNRRVVAFNDTLQVGELVSDASGNIRFELSNLANGKHEVQLRAYDADGTEIGASPAVVYYVDLEAAAVRDVYAEPEGPYAPGDFVTIFVESEPGLSEVQVQIENIQRPLVENTANPGVYSVEYRLPDVAGEYPVRVYLRDQYDNVINQESDLVLVVGEGSADLENFAATAEGDTVRLSWDLPQNTSAFKEFEISYGTSPDQLTQKMIVAATEEEALIEGLEGETMYYVMMRVISTDDTVLGRTEVLSVMTGEVAEGFTDVEVEEADGALDLRWTYEGTPADRIVLAYGLRSGTYLEEVEIAGNASSYTLDELINGTTYYLQLTAYDGQDRILYESEELRAIPGRGDSANPLDPNGTICRQSVKNLRLVNQGALRFLQWDAIPGVNTYRVYSGTAADQVTTLMGTVNGKNYFQLPDLESKEKKEYFFGVKGYCPNSGEESLDFSNILAVESGPALLLLGLATCVATVLYARRRGL